MSLSSTKLTPIVVMIHGHCYIDFTERYYKMFAKYTYMNKILLSIMNQSKCCILWTGK